jgi:hypothetical protein
MQMETGQEGLYMFFKDYQVEAIGYLQEISPKGAGSREVWEKVNEALTGTISRASIINFLNELVDIELLNYHETTGKGGHRRIYSHKFDESGFREELITRFVSKLLEAFPEVTRTVASELT